MAPDSLDVSMHPKSSRWKHLPFERQSWLPGDNDSIQWYLEMPDWYHRGHVNYVCDEGDKEIFNSMYHRLLQLEREGLMLLDWQRYDSDPTWSCSNSAR